MKHSRINPMSKKRREEKPDRDAAREAVFERDGHKCQFRQFVMNAYPLGWSETDPDRRADIAAFNPLMRCSGPLEMHEPAHSKWVGRTNVERSVTACRFHNGIAEDLPELCRKIGWAESGVGEPSRKWAWSPLSR